MEDLHDLFLQNAPQVNKHIAAENQIHPRKWRIACQVVPGKDAQIPNLLGDLEAAVALDEEAAQSFRGKVLRNGFGIDSGPRLVHSPIAQVGAEDLDRYGRGLFVQELSEGNGERVSFLSGGTARGPNANCLVAAPILHDEREHFLLEQVEGLRLAEEARDIDQDVVKERFDLLGVAVQVL